METFADRDVQARWTDRHHLPVPANRAQPFPEARLSRFTMNIESLSSLFSMFAYKVATMSLDIFLVQVFNGLSLFTVLALMAVGLAIVFGLMGVINMAHGELMALGAFMTYLTSEFFLRF